MRISDLRSPIFDFDFDFWTIFRSFFGSDIFVRLGAHAMLTRRRPSPTNDHRPTDGRRPTNFETGRQPSFVGSSVRRFVGFVGSFVVRRSLVAWPPRLLKSKDRRNVWDMLCTPQSTTINHQQATEGSFNQCCMRVCLSASVRVGESGTVDDYEVGVLQCAVVLRRVLPRWSRNRSMFCVRIEFLLRRWWRGV